MLLTERVIGERLVSTFTASQNKISDNRLWIEALRRLFMFARFSRYKWNYLLYFTSDCDLKGIIWLPSSLVPVTQAWRLAISSWRCWFALFSASQYHWPTIRPCWVTFSKMVSDQIVLVSVTDGVRTMGVKFTRDVSDSRQPTGLYTWQRTEEATVVSHGFIRDFITQVYFQNRPNAPLTEQWSQISVIPPDLNRQVLSTYDKIGRTATLNMLRLILILMWFRHQRIFMSCGQTARVVGVRCLRRISIKLNNSHSKISQVRSKHSNFKIQDL